MTKKVPITMPENWLTHKNQSRDRRKAREVGTAEATVGSSVAGAASKGGVKAMSSV